MDIARKLARFRPMAVARIGSSVYWPEVASDIDYFVVGDRPPAKRFEDGCITLKEGRYEFIIVDVPTFDENARDGEPIQDSTYMYGQFELGEKWFRDRYAELKIAPRQVRDRWVREKVEEILDNADEPELVTKAMVKLAYAIGADIEMVRRMDLGEMSKAAEWLQATSSRLPLPLPCSA
jgi:hypothetical protein